MSYVIARRVRSLGRLGEIRPSDPPSIWLTRSGSPVYSAPALPSMSIPRSEPELALAPVYASGSAGAYVGPTIQRGEDEFILPDPDRGETPYVGTYEMPDPATDEIVVDGDPAADEIVIDDGTGAPPPPPPVAKSTNWTPYLVAGGLVVVLGGVLLFGKRKK